MAAIAHLHVHPSNRSLSSGVTKVIPLSVGESLRIGRIAGNDLVLDDSRISRFHAVIAATASGIVVTDLSSLNGTFVNGHRVMGPTIVNGGESVTLGDTTVSVEVIDSENIERLVSESELEGGVLETQAASLRRVTVTVLVADICGFTKMSEVLPSQDVAAMLQRWFERVAAVVRESHGEVHKYIGDAVMAIWYGGPDEAAGKARAALQAAQEILVVTDRLSSAEQWSHHGAHPWSCRVCLNTGEALMGSLGSSNSREFTVLGDSINVAFRLEGIAKEIGKPLLLSASTANFVRENVTLSHLGARVVRGRAERIEVYELV